MGKTFTAAGIWWLAHEGRIALDTAVQRYVPEYPHEQTTVRQLLAHSYMLPPDYGFFDAPVPTLTAVQGRGIMMRLDSGVLHATALELDFVLRRSTTDTGDIR